jgi:hypothetical protein
MCVLILQQSRTLVLGAVVRSGRAVTSDKSTGAVPERCDVVVNNQI